MTRKEELIEKLVNNTITTAEIIELKNLLQLNEIRPIFKKLYGLSSSDFINKSGASEGLLGRLNNSGKEKRRKRFEKKMKSGFRSQPNTKVIIAEGDSWFEYPVYLKDILQNLIDDNDNYAVLSLALGGDWLANELYENEYEPAVDRFQPHAFLISGGGNDLVGDYRLMTFLKPIDQVAQADRNNPEKYLTDRFSAILNAFRIQYFLFFRDFTLRYPLVGKIITQGYDYPIPSNAVRLHRNLIGTLLNRTQNGKWLLEPFKMAGIHDENIQRGVMRVIIDRFNDMLITEGCSVYSNVYHIDSRGLVNTGDNVWFDELHPQSSVFKKIAMAFRDCINGASSNNNVNPNIYVVKNLHP